KGVRSQVRDVFGDIEVHAVDHRHDHDQRGGGHDYTEQSEERAQLMGAQRFQSDPERLAGRHPRGNALTGLNHFLFWRSRKWAEGCHRVTDLPEIDVSTANVTSAMGGPGVEAPGLCFPSVRLVE